MPKFFYFNSERRYDVELRSPELIYVPFLGVSYAITPDEYRRLRETPPNSCVRVLQGSMCLVRQ